MVKRWYPPDVTSPEERLRYYAGQFDTVEVDSTFYALPRRDVAARWAERTPDWFVFHIKAFGLMTGHSVEPRALPRDLRELPHGVTRHGRVKDPSFELEEAVYERFREGIEPLREAGKLGGILLQFPVWFSSRDRKERNRNLEHLEKVRSELEGYRLFVEFRHGSWVDDDHRADTLAFLAEHEMGYVSVDEPQVLGAATVPPIAEATTDWAYVRFHGRNAETWSKRTEKASDRFDYLYSESELREWEGPVRSLAAATETTFVLFNNNKYDYAQRNAQMMNEILGDLLLPVPHGTAAPQQEELF